MDEHPVEPEVLPGPPRPDERRIVLLRHVYPNALTILPLAERPFFPRMTIPAMVQDEALKRAIAGIAASEQKFLGLLLRRDGGGVDGDDTPPGPADLHDVGVVAEIRQTLWPAPEAPLQMILGLHERFRVTGWARSDPPLVAQVEVLPEADLSDNEELKAFALAVVNALKDLVQLNPLHKEELNLFLQRSSLHEPGRLADFGAALTSARGEDVQEILATQSVRERLRKTLVLIRKEIDLTRLQAKISKQIEERVSRQQREFLLREQLKEIKRELGLEKEGKDAEVERFEKRLSGLKLTAEAEERVRDELDKLRLIEPASPEFTVGRNYLDWLTSLPWGVFTKDAYDLKAARRILDRDHFGLDDVKNRILEFLAVGARKGGVGGSILCFVGPPGVGKTSIGQSIARALGRKFYRFSVGGMRDEAEIKGHRRTYIGALPGKFLQAMRTCGAQNPVLMLDEVDKIGASFQGDPASALLEVLDPEQNRDFLDHYLDVRFDLSNAFFICTANQLDTIPRPLLDRMEVINLAGYLLSEKTEIARRHLLPRQLEAHGLGKDQVTLTPRALKEVVEGYAREPGVRNLENLLKKMLRKSVMRMAESGDERVRIDAADVPGLLGRRVFRDEAAQEPTPGVVTGLAWTPLGGDVLSIEATRVATGRPGFQQTGQLGSVMVESSQIAYTYVRSLLDADEGARKFFEEGALHLHVPAGATPKDGPSAGVTMATALYGLATGRTVRPKLAMTGELTLTGRVMPIGGVREKTLAARRAGVTDVILPEANRSDWEDLPAFVREGVVAHFAKRFEDVARAAFPGAISLRTSAAGRRGARRTRGTARPGGRGQ